MKGFHFCGVDKVTKERNQVEFNFFADFNPLTGKSGPYFFPKKWSDLKGGYNEDVDWDPILFPGTMFKEQHPENEGGGETILCMAMRRYDGYWNSDWFTLREFDKDGKETTDWGRDYPKRKNYVAILEP